MQIRGRWTILLRLVVLLLLSPSGAIIAGQGNHAGPAKIAISIENDVVVVPVKLQANSRPLRFIVDTGSEITTIDSRTAKMLRLRVGADVDLETVAGETAMPTVQLSALRIGPYRAASVRVATYDLSQLSAKMGSQVEGVLGIDVLRHFSFQISYSHKTMVISDSEILPGMSERVALQPVDGGYLVPTKLNPGSEINLLLDTGSNMTVLPWTVWRPLVEEWGPRKLLKGESSSQQEAGHSCLIRLDSIEIEGARIDSPVVRLLFPAVTGTFSETDAPGLLGADILRQFVVTFNLQQRELFLRRDPEFHQDPFEYSSIGIQYRRNAKQIYVIGVWESSPADEARLRKGDQILELQGKSASSLSNPQIERMLRGPEGTVVTLKILRSGKILTLTVPRRKLI